MNTYEIANEVYRLARLRNALVEARKRSAYERDVERLDSAMARTLERLERTARVFA